MYIWIDRSAIVKYLGTLNLTSSGSCCAYLFVRWWTRGHPLQPPLRHRDHLSGSHPYLRSRATVTHLPSCFPTRTYYHLSLHFIPWSIKLHSLRPRLTSCKISLQSPSASLIRFDPAWFAGPEHSVVICILAFRPTHSSSLAVNNQSIWALTSRDGDSFAKSTANTYMAEWLVFRRQRPTFDTAET